MESKDAAMMLLQGISQALNTSRNRWIRVEDELPDKNVPVLVWEKQGFAYIDRLEAECAWQIASTHHAIITHWMPLPEPPKEDDNEAD